MEKSIRRKHTPEFKTQVVLELLKETKTIGEIGSEYSVHPNLIAKWRTTAIEGLKDVFTGRSGNELTQKDRLIDELYRQVGQLKVELDWLKKKMGFVR